MIFVNRRLINLERGSMKGVRPSLPPSPSSSLLARRRPSGAWIYQRLSKRIATFSEMAIWSEDNLPSNIFRGFPFVCSCEFQEKGMDFSKHGGRTYPEFMTSIEAMVETTEAKAQEAKV